ncbi:CD180 antigen-like [Lytechinus pictus]|uniref:CD180 antigen-like n=1 Tax=Lytechinus pictus TaxID=7653 RepID=UPI0030B9E92C
MASTPLYTLLCLWINCVLFFLSGGLSMKCDMSGRNGSLNWSSMSTSRCQLTYTSCGVKANCKNLSLHSVPKGLPHNTIVLDLSRNIIETLHNKSFTYLPDIIKLDLSLNRITLIGDGTFKPLGNLTELDLWYNNIKFLPAGLLHSNKLLSVFDISLNQLRSFPKDALPWTNHMKSLDLYSNREISSISPLDFAPLQNCSLIKLQMSLCGLKNLPTNSFAAFKRIQHLRLDGNLMDRQEIHMSSFSGINEINELSLSSCKINSIIPLNRSFHHLHDSPKIHLISLIWNKLNSFPDFVFWGLNETNILRLDNNQISSLSNYTFCGLDQLIELDLSCNELIYLPHGMFFCNKLLQELRLTCNHNKIVSWSGSTVSNLCSLNHLYLSDNRIQNIDKGTQTLPSLEYLDLSFNAFHNVHIYPKFLQCYTNLKRLDMSYNELQWISPHAFSSLTNLEELYLNNEFFYLKEFPNAFQNIRNLHILDLSSAISYIYPCNVSQFTNLTSLMRLVLRKNNLQSRHLFNNFTSRSLFTGLETLLTLDLRENDLAMLAPETFNPLKKLEILLLSQSSIKVLFSGVFESLTSLKTLDLSDNHISSLSGNIFPIQSQLSILIMSNNNIRNISTTLFNINPHLQSLNIQQNKITTIKGGRISLKNFTIDASGNPFDCTCDLRWFVRWLRSTNVEVIHPNDTNCSRYSIEDMVESPILSFNPDKYCGINILLITSVSLTAILVVALSLLAYWKRWWFNYKAFLLRLAICGYKEMVQDIEDHDYEYQLNLMFQEEDQEWVDYIMKPVLQERFPHLERVVFGDNDLHLGMFYINALHYAVENSFKTVLLLSNNSVREAWFITKVRIALEELNDSRLDKVILFFLEDIDDDDLPYLVRLFLSKNKPYMLWTDDEDGQELFWAQFEKSMRYNKELNSVIPV